MGVEQTTVIDAIGIDKVSGAVHLTIADALEWDADHLRLLQEKLNAYLAFVESGELYSAYPSAAERPVVLDLRLRLSDQEFDAVSHLGADQRFAHFLRRVADWARVWELRDEAGWVAAADSEGHSIFPLWPHPRHAAACADHYGTLEGKLRLLDTILQNCWITPEETLKLQCLGVTFGDALAQRLGLAWVAVEDDAGRNPALVAEGTSIRVFPLTSIAKRIERGEEVVIGDLFEGACATIERLRAEETHRAGGHCARRLVGAARDGSQ